MRFDPAELDAGGISGALSRLLQVGVLPVPGVLGAVRGHARNLACSQLARFSGRFRLILVKGEPEGVGGQQTAKPY